MGYVLATLTGGVIAALVHRYVLAAASAPTVDTDEPQPSAGDRNLATGDSD